MGKKSIPVFHTIRQDWKIKINKQDIICNISALKCPKMTHLMLNILFNCVLTLSEMFPAMFKHRWILILFKGLVCFIWLHVFVASRETSGDSSENVTECDMSKSLMHTVGVIWSDFISNGGSLALRTAAPVMIPSYFTRHQQTRSFFLLIYALTEMTNRAFEFVGFIFLLFCLPLFITQPLRFI